MRFLKEAGTHIEIMAEDRRRELESQYKELEKMLDETSDNNPYMQIKLQSEMEKISDELEDLKKDFPY